MLNTRLSVIVTTVVSFSIVCALAAVIRDIVVRRAYERAFADTRIGEPLNSVLLRFGEPSDVAGHIQPGETGRQPPCDNQCSLRLWYMSPILGGVSPYSIDFDSDQRVISKYHWASP